jgi:hypothetical protein
MLLLLRWRQCLMRQPWGAYYIHHLLLLLLCRRRVHMHNRLRQLLRVHPGCIAGWCLVHHELLVVLWRIHHLRRHLQGRLLHKHRLLHRHQLQMRLLRDWVYGHHLDMLLLLHRLLVR